MPSMGWGGPGGTVDSNKKIIHTRCGANLFETCVGVVSSMASFPARPELRSASALPLQVTVCPENFPRIFRAHVAACLGYLLAYATPAGLPLNWG